MDRITHEVELDAYTVSGFLRREVDFTLAVLNDLAGYANPVRIANGVQPGTDYAGLIQFLRSLADSVERKGSENS